MDFSQRRNHFIVWCVAGGALLLGLPAAIHASLDRVTQPDGGFVVYDRGRVLDSLRYEELHTDFILRQSHELYMEVRVGEELPITSLKAYHGDSLAGFIESKGTHIFNYSGHRIEDITLKDPITGRIYLVGNDD